MQVVKGCSELMDYFDKESINYGGNIPHFYYFIGEDNIWTLSVSLKPEMVPVSLKEYLKSRQMEKYSVDKEFILEAHTAACDEWKEKIEAKFPSLFEEPNYIGKSYRPCDMSYIKCLDYKKGLYNEILGQLCTIISNPYKKKVDTTNNIFNFVDVLCKNHTYSVLFNKQNIQ